jgi:hypothetical protein
MFFDRRIGNRVGYVPTIHPQVGSIPETNCPMKNVSLFFLIASFLFVIGCDSESETKNLVFNVQSDFEDDMVAIYVDATLVLNQNVTTNHTLGVDLNAMKTVEVATGNHSIRVIVNGADELTTTVNLNSELYIGVRYDQQTGEVSIDQSLEPYVYD